jgi:hypothetical protein
MESWTDKFIYWTMCITTIAAVVASSLFGVQSCSYKSEANALHDQLNTAQKQIELQKQNIKTIELKLKYYENQTDSLVVLPDL